ncbi:hypothetical protein GGI25_002031, partial [Coemansia spiralis]
MPSKRANPALGSYTAIFYEDSEEQEEQGGATPCSRNMANIPAAAPTEHIPELKLLFQNLHGIGVGNKKTLPITNKWIGLEKPAAINCSVVRCEDKLGRLYNALKCSSPSLEHVVDVVFLQ